MIDQKGWQVHATWDDVQLSKEMLGGLMRRTSEAFAREENWGKVVS